MNLNQLLLANAIVIVGAFVQGSIGMGFALISAPILILISQTFVPGPLVFAGFVISTLVIFREHHSIDFTGLKPAIGGRIIGTILGAGMLLLVLLLRQLNIYHRANNK